MAADTAITKTEKRAEQSKTVSFWCNFCNFTTDDQTKYLAHSCTDELKKRGIAVEATGQNECR